MHRTWFLKGLLILVYGGFLVWLWAAWPSPPETLWAVPGILLLFFLIYHYDITVKGVGHLNIDHVVAFPAAVLLNHPALAGLLAGLGLLGSRVYRRGLRRLVPTLAFSAVLVSGSLSFGCWLYLRFPSGGRRNPVLTFLLLLAAMIASTGANWAGYVISRFFQEERVLTKVVKHSFLSNMKWVVLSSPFVALLVDVTQDRRYLYILLGSLTLLVVIWALRLSAKLEEKNKALSRASGRQEFLQQLSSIESADFQDDRFVLDVMTGLRDFIPWDRGVLMATLPSESGEPELYSLEGLPADPDTLKESLSDLVNRAWEGGALENKMGPRPHLLAEPGDQVLMKMATSELIFGVLLLERTLGSRPFSEEETRFITLALGEIAGHIQEDILRKQLLLTNRKLLQQTDYLSQILTISNLLKVHLDAQTILEKVAMGIQEGMGFKAVLISLYREDERCFERIAQAGLDDQWEEVRLVRPPEKEVFNLLQEQFRVGNCYFVKHTEAIISPYNVMPSNPSVPKEPDDWDPMDGLFVPLVDKEDHLLGVISLDEPVDGKIPSLEALRALEVLANQTVSALEGAQIHAKTRRRAVMDSLTDLYNHGHFQQVLAEQSRQHEENNQVYSILMMDLDDFKAVNDRYGHLAGDQVLKRVSNVLQSNIRQGDVAARYGGEEFALLLPRCDKDRADDIAERIREAVEKIRVPGPEGGPVIGVTISIGLASFPADGKTHQSVLGSADHALYMAKRKGKNRVSVVG